MPASEPRDLRNLEIPKVFNLLTGRDKIRTEAALEFIRHNYFVSDRNIYYIMGQEKDFSHLEGTTWTEETASEIYKAVVNKTYSLEFNNPSQLDIFEK